jgi:hypothetical protein
MASAKRTEATSGHAKDAALYPTDRLLAELLAMVYSP